MSDNSKSSKAFGELVRILEEALQAGVTSIGLEYEDGGLMVYYQTGNLGVGANRIPDELEEAVLKELVKRAGLEQKSKGKMKLSLLGAEYQIHVEEYDSFGESAFNLTIRK